MRGVFAIPVVCLILALTGCSGSAGPLDGYEPGKGTVHDFILNAAPKLGVHLLQTNALPPIPGKWYYQARPNELTIVMPGDRFPEFHAFLTNAVGPAQGSPTADKPTGILEKYYGTNLTATVCCMSGMAAAGKKYTSLIIVGYGATVANQAGYAQLLREGGELSNYVAQVLGTDTRRDGIVDLKVDLLISNTVSRACVKLTCHRRAEASPNWLVGFMSIKATNSSTDPGESTAQLVADATRFAANALLKEHGHGPVAAVQIQEQNMPDFIRQQIYETLTAQMSLADGRAQPAYDRQLKRMLRTALDESQTVQLIARRLADAGFARTRAEPPELINVRENLVGKTWRKIAFEKDAGLEIGSATVTYSDLRGDKLH
jgi:hypothetical protein